MSSDIVIILSDKVKIIANSEKKKAAFLKISDKTKRKARIESLYKKANEDSKEFNKRKLLATFNPVIGGFISLNGDICGSDKNNLISLAGEFFNSLDKYFGIKVFNYMLYDIDKFSKFFQWEALNYSFSTHKVIRGNYIKSRVKELNGLAEKIFSRYETHGAGINWTVNDIESASGQTAVKKKITGESEEEVLKPFKPDIWRNIQTEVNLISAAWSLLSPKGITPVLEPGMPAEVNNASWIRIYFQKPQVRQITWRLRHNPEMKSVKPLVRVYADETMLWYETLSLLTGSKYIIFPEKLELSRTWAEIGYITDSGEFIFVARTPVWPPDCLFKPSPNKSAPRKIPKKLSLMGATESFKAGGIIPGSLQGSL